MCACGVEVSVNSVQHEAADDDDDDDVEDDDAAADKLLRAPSPTPSNNSSSGEEPEEPSDAYKYQRRRSRAVLYQLSGTYGKHKSTKSKLQLNKVTIFLKLIILATTHYAI